MIQKNNIRLIYLFLQSGLAIFIFGCILIAGMFLYFDHWRRGVLVFGSAVIIVAMAVLVLPESAFIIVRSKKIDATILFLIGITIVYLALSIKSLGT